MTIRSQWRSWLCLATILGVIVYCTCHNAARAEPPRMDIALAPFDVPFDAPADLRSSPSLAAPFGLTQPALADAPAQAMAAKWRTLQAIVAVETRAMTLCRQTPETCAPSTARFLSFIDAANQAIRPVRDTAQFGVADVWQSPLMTFASGSGDCEDYAIAKYVALRAAGLSIDDLKFVIVRNDALGEDHAVTAARIDGEWLILDNRKMLLLSDAQASDLKPLIALGEEAPRPALIRDAGLDEWFVAMAEAVG
jgi:predicted transglutaminase-like cysteine proteinase